MKVIFCDVDGVLNNSDTTSRTPNGYIGVSDQLIRNLKKIADASGAAIVLSSDWRLMREDPKYGKDYRYLERKLRYVGKLKISDHTADISWKLRGLEIKRFLDEHPEVTDFVILDDLPFWSFLSNGLLGKLVLTDPKKGLTEANIKRAISILNGEKVPLCNSRIFMAR